MDDSPGTTYEVVFDYKTEADGQQHVGFFKGVFYLLPSRAFAERAADALLSVFVEQFPSVHPDRCLLDATVRVFERTHKFERVYSRPASELALGVSP